jgi:hypothetical protein
MLLIKSVLSQAKLQYENWSHILKFCKTKTKIPNYMQFIQIL